MENSNRYRVSTDFLFPRMIILLVIIFMLYNIVDAAWHHRLYLMWGGYFVFAIGLIVFLYILGRSKRVEYDEANRTLYVFNARKELANEIPVERIEKILYSIVGFGYGSRSYLIVYKSENRERKKIRLFPIPFSNHIRTIIADAKARNPKLITRRWTFGWNEFFD